MCYIHVSILVFLLYEYVGKLSAAVETQTKETDSNIVPSIVAVYLSQMISTTEIIVIICYITNLNTEGSVNVCMCTCIIHFISTCFEIY
jgi:hypothetical protein